MNEPQDTHWPVVKQILRYLKHTIDHGLLIRKCSSNQLFAFLDVDWASCLDDRRSTSGFCIFLGSNLLSWSSKKQPVVSCLTTESKYKSMANTAADLCWLQSLFSELCVFLPIVPILYCDNIGATYLSANPVFHAWTKHISIDYHFVRDRVATKVSLSSFSPAKIKLPMS
jgi:hypothetical protein